MITFNFSIKFIDIKFEPSQILPKVNLLPKSSILFTVRRLSSLFVLRIAQSENKPSCNSA